VTISDKIHDELIHRALKRSKETDKVLSRGNRRLIIINDESKEQPPIRPRA
jgi:hypothetical protein